MLLCIKPSVASAAKSIKLIKLSKLQEEADSYLFVLFSDVKKSILIICLYHIMRINQYTSFQ